MVRSVSGGGGQQCGREGAPREHRQLHGGQLGDGAAPAAARAAVLRQHRRGGRTRGRPLQQRPVQALAARAAGLGRARRAWAQQPAAHHPVFRAYTCHSSPCEAGRSAALGLMRQQARSDCYVPHASPMKLLQEPWAAAQKRRIHGGASGLQHTCWSTLFCSWSSSCHYASVVEMPDSGTHLNCRSQSPQVRPPSGSRSRALCTTKSSPRSRAAAKRSQGACRGKPHCQLWCLSHSNGALTGLECAGYRTANVSRAPGLGRCAPCSRRPGQTGPKRM